MNIAELLRGILGEWRHEAACNPHMADEFFATDKRGKYATRQAKEAKTYCREYCPVLEQCLAWVLADDERRNAAGIALNEGVWAATDENERRVILHPDRDALPARPELERDRVGALRQRPHLPAPLRHQPRRPAALDGQR